MPSPTRFPVGSLLPGVQNLIGEVDPYRIALN